MWEKCFSIAGTKRDVRKTSCSATPASSLDGIVSLVRIYAAHSEFAILTSPFGQKRDSIEEPKTELEGKDSSSVEYVDLNSKKDQENPVSHSFEKMETADEYQGGYRVQDGQDELQSHNAALSELNMQSVTRDGESAQSVYRSTINAAFESDEAYDQGARSATFDVSEWDYKKALKRNHCRLYINSGQQVCRSDDDLKWRRDLLERHRRQLSYWGQKLQKLLNTENG